MTAAHHAVTQGDLIRKTPRNRNGIQASYWNGRQAKAIVNITREGLAAWFLGFADACADGEAPRTLP